MNTLVNVEGSERHEQEYIEHKEFQAINAAAKRFGAAVRGGVSMTLGAGVANIFAN